jgi:cyclase
LDVKDGRVVKGTKFLDLKDAGDPVETAARYDRDGADEICFLDITASHEARGTILDVVRRTAACCFCPLTVGGGLRTVEDVRSTLRAGADKVSINSAAVKNPALLSEGATAFGRQCIVLAIDAKRAPNFNPEKPTWHVFIHGGRIDTGRDVLEWAREGVERGAGEILLTSMDADGTRAGYDLELTRAVSLAVEAPVIASGGAGEPEHLAEAFQIGLADAALAAGIFHYGKYTLPLVREFLRGRGVHVRPEVSSA